MCARRSVHTNMKLVSTMSQIPETRHRASAGIPHEWTDLLQVSTRIFQDGSTEEEWLEENFMHLF